METVRLIAGAKFLGGTGDFSFDSSMAGFERQKPTSPGHSAPHPENREVKQLEHDHGRLGRVQLSGSLD